jgi:signal transduction histidine kinase
VATTLGGIVARTDPINILLVDDQPARLMSYISILEELGENLITARSGIEALEQLMKNDFAVVLLDVSMPGMDGFETAGLIREHPRFEKTPIIFVTGVHVTEPDQLKAYKLGAVDYVYIPIIPEILRGKVTVLVDLYCKGAELQRVNKTLAEANVRLEQANTTLQAERNRELEMLNRTLSNANAELATSIHALQQEVTERARAEGALKDADRQKNEFLAILAHELRNPLAPIRNAVQIMNRKQLADPEVVWARELIERQLLQLARLVDDLLDVSRITSGTINLVKEPVSLATVIARAIETAQPLIAQQGHELVVQVPQDAPNVEADVIRLIQAISNLINNAAKYTNAGGRITVKAVISADAVQICVADNGIGIPPEALPHIFNLFSRLDKHDTGPRGGLGVGLALARRLVEMHGGTLSAHSSGVDAGSEFRVILPLGKLQTLPLLQSSAAPIRSAVFKRRILVADDNADALASLALLLEDDGHTVYQACNGLEAVERAAQHHPEVALLDIGMPGIDGHDVSRRIREQPWGKQMVLIAITGWGQEEDRRRSIEAGFDSHLTKPVDLAILFDLLCQLSPTVVGAEGDAAAAIAGLR